LATKAIFFGKGFSLNLYNLFFVGFSFLLYGRGSGRDILFQEEGIYFNDISGGDIFGKWHNLM